MITTVVLTNTASTSHNCHFFFVVRTFVIYFLGNIQVHKTGLLAIITKFCVPFSELIHLITGSLYPLTNISLFLLLPDSWKPPFFSVSMNFGGFFFLDSIYK